MSGPALPGVLFEREIAPAPARGGSVLVAFVPDAPLALTIRQTTRQYPIARHDTSDVEVLVAGTVFGAASLATLVGLPSSVSIAPALHEAYLRLGDQFLEPVVGRFAVLVADLTARPEVSREINRLVVAEHLVHRWIDVHETYFADVWRAPPGQLLEVVGGGETLRRYWNPGGDGPFEPMADDEAIERFDHHLRRAVLRCLGSSRTGTLLSGGFDSVSVAATATALTREDGRPAPHSPSVVLPDPECDEQVIQFNPHDAERRVAC